MQNAKLRVTSLRLYKWVWAVPTHNFALCILRFAFKKPPEGGCELFFCNMYIELVVGDMYACLVKLCLDTLIHIVIG